MANPFAEIDVLIKDDVTAKWTKGVFAVNRDVYEGDEQVCAALEHAVWVKLMLFTVLYLHRYVIVIFV